MNAKRTYAAGTDVPVERTRLEIERLVRKTGATAFGFIEEADAARIQFRLEGTVLRFDLTLPRIEDDAFQRVHRGAAGIQPRKPAEARSVWERACREHWRSLLLTIKAKLNAIELGIVTFEDEFLAHVVMPDGRTVGDVLRQQLPAIRAGEPVKLLSDFTGGGKG